MSGESGGTRGTVTWAELWGQAAEAVGSRPSARWLCEVASGLDGDEFLAAQRDPATVRMVAHLDAMVARVRTGEPLQYVLGRWGFRRLDLMVDRRVLIPRPETEIVAEVAIELCRAVGSPVVAADLGTGSGAIGLSLAAELPREGTTVWITDVSADALDVARANLAGIGRAAANVRVAQGSWFVALPEGLRGGLDVIVANPPYVALDDPGLEPAVAEWEPHGALFAGSDGLDDIRAIVQAAPLWLRPGGWLVVEIGERQGDAVRALAGESGFEDVEVRRDLSGSERVLVVRTNRLVCR